MTFEINKIIMAILIALLISKVGSIIGKSLVSPEYLEKHIYTGPGYVEDKKPLSSVDENVLELIEPFLLKADLNNGEKISKKCLQCHTLNKEGINKIGPNLWGVLDRKIASKKEYNYSRALLNKEGNWTYSALNKFLFKPSQDIPGTKMSFSGIQKSKDRADLISYLRILCDNPSPFKIQ